MVDALVLLLCLGGTLIATAVGLRDVARMRKGITQVAPQPTQAEAKAQNPMPLGEPTLAHVEWTPHSDFREPGDVWVKRVRDSLDQQTYETHFIDIVKLPIATERPEEPHFRPVFFLQSNDLLSPIGKWQKLDPDISISERPAYHAQVRKRPASAQPSFKLRSRSVSDRKVEVEND